MRLGAEHDDHYTATRYFALVGEGLLAPDERVELLEGIIVSMPPHLPTHANGVRVAEQALRLALGPDVVISAQLPFVAGTASVPEPDFAVLPGRIRDYATQHPTRALLIVEIAESSLAQDRLTKSRIYAKAGVPDYWIVNLRNHVVEWFSNPDPETRLYRDRGTATGPDRLPLSAFPEAVLVAADLLPDL